MKAKPLSSFLWKKIVMFFLMILFLFKRNIHPNTVRSCLVKGEKDTYCQASYSQTSARIVSSRMTFLLWIVTGHVPCRTCLGYAKQRIYRRENIAKNLIELHEALLCSKNETIFHRVVVHQMSIQWVAYVVNSWLLELDTLDINVVKNISWPSFV